MNRGINYTAAINPSISRSFSRKLAPLRHSSDFSQKTNDVSDVVDRKLVSNSMESYNSNWNVDNEDDNNIQVSATDNTEDLDKYTYYTSFPSYNSKHNNLNDEDEEEDGDMDHSNGSESSISTFIYNIHEAINDISGIPNVILDTYKLNTQNEVLNINNTSSCSATKGLLYPELKLLKLKHLYSGIFLV